jgi:hypothetical protein
MVSRENSDLKKELERVKRELGKQKKLPVNPAMSVEIFAMPRPWRA